MEKLIKFLFSRLVIVAILIFIQALILVGLIWNLSNHFVYVYGTFMILSMIMVVWLVSKDDNPSLKLSWVIMILVFPVFGGLFYVLFAHTRIPNKERVKMNELLEKSKESYYNDNDVFEELESKSRHAASQSRYIKNQSFGPVYKNTTTEYFKLGEILFEKMKEELENAEHYIFLEYFILQEGKMWSELLEILKRKAKQGVDVRVIYDDCGSVSTVPYKYNKKLEAMGIKCEIFNPYRPILSISLQNRDHRKIMIIDGHTAFNGGVNIADEYINEYPKYGHFKDCGIMIKGEAVFNFTVMFLETWNYYRNIDDEYSEFMPNIYFNGEFESDGYVQPFGDTPLDNEYVGETVYMNMINQATNYVYINTPYLIVDNEVITALLMAAKRGVDVRIVLPAKGEELVCMVNRSYYKQLIESGVRIYEYSPGYIHSKTFVVDDEFATVGTINLDYRSLYHNYECATWMYKTKVVSQLYEDYLETLKVCKEITLEDCLSVPLYRRAVRGIFRIVAPLM